MQPGIDRKDLHPKPDLITSSRLPSRLPQILIAAVLLMNVQCAVAFILRPGIYTPAFELSGAPGEAAVRGFGVLFLMWNLPYAVALWDPRRFRTVLLIAIAMQAVGLFGELLILLSIPSEFTSLRSSIMRFCYFDAAGLIALVAAALLTPPARQAPDPPAPPP